MNLFRNALLVLTLVSALHCLEGAATAETISIQQFMTYQEKWPQLAKASSSWTLEGRYGSIGKNDLRFSNCPMRFALPKNMPFTAAGSKVVEVTGRLVQEGNEVYFQVDKVLTRPNDEETLRARRAGVNSRLAKSWYDLADWAQTRGDFYHDQSLQAAALDLRQVGIEVERRELKSDDHVALLALAQKALTLGLSSEYVREMQHSAYRHRYSLALEKNRADVDELVVLLKQQLAGGKKFLAAIDPELQASYSQQPIEFYATATAERRDILDRLFVIELERLRIDRDIKPDGSNGNEIAARLEGFLPEYAALAEEHRVKELDYQVSRVGAMTRQEMLDLTKKFAARTEPEREAEVKRKWLEAREPGMRRDRGRGLCDLAEDWITLLSDNEKAKELYLEAYRTDPGYPLSTVWLTNNGYVQQRGTWIRKEEAPESEESEMETAIREGRIMLGMTGEQVRTAMGTVPTSTLRFATSRGVTELMVFEASGVMVRLHRKTHLGTAKVIAIGAITAESASEPGSGPLPAAE